MIYDYFMIVDDEINKDNFILLNTNTYKTESYCRDKLLSLIRSGKSIGNCILSYGDLLCRLSDYNKHKTMFDSMFDFKSFDILNGDDICIQTTVRDDLILVKDDYSRFSIWCRGYGACNLSIRDLCKYANVINDGKVLIGCYLYLSDNDEWMFGVPKNKKVNVLDYVRAKGKPIDRSIFAKNCLLG